MKGIALIQWKWFLFRNRFVRSMGHDDLRNVVDILLEMPPRQMNKQLMDTCLVALHPEIDDPKYVAPSQERVLASVRDYLQSTERTQIPDRNAAAQNRKNDARMRKYRPALVSAIVLLTVLILGTAIAYALGYPIWNYAFHWEEEQLQINIEIHAPASTTGLVPHMQHRGVGKGDAFDEKLKELQFDISLPQLTDKYSLSNMDSSAGGIISTIIGFYKAGETELHILVQKIDGENANGTSSVEKDGGHEVLTISETDYYLFTNIDFEEALWISPPYIVQIGGNLDRKEIVSLLYAIDGNSI